MSVFLRVIVEAFMAVEKGTFQESFLVARDTKMFIKRKAPLHGTSSGKQYCQELGNATPLLPQVIFIFCFPRGAVKYKKQVHLIATASATERFHSLKPKKFKRGQKLPPKDFFLWTALSFMTHRAQPLAAISSKKTIELSLLYFLFLNTIASIWIYVLPQKVWTKKPMLLKEQNHILEEKSK